MTCYSWMVFFVFFFKQKTAYEMRISDWSSDVCSSDLTEKVWSLTNASIEPEWVISELPHLLARRRFDPRWSCAQGRVIGSEQVSLFGLRSEEHTSELQSLMRISYAAFCLKNKNK